MEHLSNAHLIAARAEQSRRLSNTAAPLDTRRDAARALARIAAEIARRAARN